jgi:enoyl-CoA hydratase/carnithine racemase/pimeloyl-ACP methyl ester carboxylesterase
MPLALTGDGTKIFFERHAPAGAGADRPVIVALPVMGTSGQLYANAVQPGVEAGYAVVTIDHRGSGRSGRSQGPWSTAIGADDVVAVLDEIGIERAHISGASLGGMVAQEVALRHPGRTGALVLFATTGGWPRLDLISPLAILRLARSTFRSARRPLSVDSRVERALRVWFSADFAEKAHPGGPAWEALRTIFEEMEEASPDSRRGQLLAALRHSTWRRLPQISAPTLVQHGGDDKVISWRAGERLARMIPQAEFHLWPGAGHALGLEIPGRSYRLGLRFLSQHDHLIDSKRHRKQEVAMASKQTEARAKHRRDESKSGNELVYEEHDAVARVMLNRPKSRNALSMQLSQELIDALARVAKSTKLKALVITGAGGTFSAGDDITEMEQWGDPNDVMRRVRQYQGMANQIEELDKMTIAAVDGYAVGGGLELTMACDFVIATERACWGMPEIDSGITPGWGGTTRMARLIGRRMTKEINFIGALHSARRAVELGLWNRVVPDDELEQEVGSLLAVLSSKNQQALRQLKLIINRGVEADLYTAQGFEVLSAGLTGAVNGAWEVADSDRGMGVQSFAEKGEMWQSRRALARHFWAD